MIPIVGQDATLPIPFVSSDVETLVKSDGQGLFLDFAWNERLVLGTMLTSSCVIASC